MSEVRTGQADGEPERKTFEARFHERFYDPAFDGEREAIQRLATIAWHNLKGSRKAPLSTAAGPASRRVRSS